MLGGFCQTAKIKESKTTGNQQHWHQRCHGSWRQFSGIIRCTCVCHSDYKPPRDMDAEIKAARLIRELRKAPQQHYPGTPSRATGRADGKCKNEHEMTPENTGPGNVCRQCKRDSSRRHKERKVLQSK